MYKGKSSRFTDRESGTYAGLMLSLREYRDRLDVHHGVELNKKPRYLDCLIIDKQNPSEMLDNDIARFFNRCNIVELKNPREPLSMDTIWKVISYAAQYKSECDDHKKLSVDDITITLIRSARPVKVFKELRRRYDIDNPYDGIYYIRGMVDIRLQIVVTRELKGDAFVPLRIQRYNADECDYRLFADSVRNAYTQEEKGYVESIIKHGIYDNKSLLFDLLKEDNGMFYDEMMELFQVEIDRKIEEGKDGWLAEGEAKGIKKGRKEGRKEARKEAKAELDKMATENKKLKEQLAQIKEELKKSKIAML